MDTMIECLVLGDSIAVGVSRAAPQCQAVAIGGINSRAFAAKVRTWKEDRSARHTIISIGTNDLAKMNTHEYVTQIRERIRGPVTWILPSQEIKPQQRAIVDDVARFWGDTVLSVEPHQLSTDRIHLTGNGYKEVATKILKD
jgi:lysophospholipase L1-like esterase